MYESLIVMLGGIIVYGVVYQFYVKWFDRNVVQMDPTRPTPAHTYMDGVEFFPSNKYVMLGWHWKSIAALGPVTGPALAIVWGWLPGFLWIIIGNSLMGWLHDYNAMASSVRNEGASLGPLTHQLIGPRARTVLVWFLVFYTIMVLAAFIGALAPVLINQVAGHPGTYAFGGPATIVSFFALAIIGVASGFAVFKAKINVLAVTVISLVVLAASIYLIQVVAGPAINSAFYNAVPNLIDEQDIMIIAMLVFSLIGAIVPLWAFAMPINYLGFYVAYFVIAAILGSSVFVPQTFSQPMVTSLFANLTIGGLGSSAVLFAFPLWPLMFVTIACGAISGWHGLIGASLSSKQIDNESDAHFVGGGAMLLEGILGLTAVVAVASLKTNFSTTVIPALGTYVKGGAVYLSNLGMGSTVSISVMSLMVVVLGLTLTQLALKFARLAVSDASGIRAFKNIYLTAGIVAIITYLLTSYRVSPVGLWSFIWVLFGGSNQLLAGVTLLVTTLWLIKIHRPSLFTGIPAIFMLATTIPALIYTAYATFSIGFSHAGALSYGSYTAGIISVILTILGLILSYDGYKAYRGLKTGAVAAPVATTAGMPARAIDKSVEAARKPTTQDG